MLRSFWSYVSSTPQKSPHPQSQPVSPEGLPTLNIDQSEQLFNMPGSSQRLSTPKHDDNIEEPVSSPNTKRKKHRKKAKDSPVSIVEVPATAEQPNEQLGEEEQEEEGMMADVSNTEAGAKRKRRKGDLELSEKKAKRPKKNRKNLEEGDQIVVNGFTPINRDTEEQDEEADLPGVADPDILGVRWFGDTPGVLHQGSWVEADIGNVVSPHKRRKKTRKTSNEKEPDDESGAGPEPAVEGEEQQPEPELVQETDPEEPTVEKFQESQKPTKKRSKKQQEKSPELPEQASREGPQPIEANEDEGAATKQRKRREKRAHKQHEAEPEPKSEPAPKERKRRKPSENPPDDSTRRRTYVRTPEGLKVPPVIMPTAITGSHSNSKGVAPPPVPVEYEKGPYTPLEDAIIHNVVHHYCQLQTPSLNRAGFIKLLWNNDRHKTDFWNILLTNLPLRTRYSLYNHVKRLYNDFEDRGKWTEEQDAELQELVAQKGMKWSIIGGLINRMPEDCRDRWKNYLVCGEKRRKHIWDDEENEKFKEIVDEMLTALVAHHEEEGTLVLKAVEGEGEEERAARLENEKGYHREEIDWTIVSDRMGRTRSRMQCLWKGKALFDKMPTGLEYGSVKRALPGYKSVTPKPAKEKSKRGPKKKQAAEGEDDEETGPVASPTLAEAKKMLPGDYLYVMQRISAQGYDCLASIDWNKIAQTDSIRYFTPEQFKAGFHNYMRDYNSEKKDLRSFVAEQLEDLSELPGMVKNKRYRQPVGTPTSAGAQAASASPIRNLKAAERPTHSPGNPFAKQPKKEKQTASTPSKAPKISTKKALKQSPKKIFKSTELISDSDSDAVIHKGIPEEENPGLEAPAQPDENDGHEDLVESGVPESGSQADDEMGESVAFGNATKSKGR